MVRPRFLMFMTLLLAMLAASQAVPAQTKDIPERSDIEAKYKWRLDKIYPSDEAWETAFSELQGTIGEYAGYKGRLSEGGNVLLEVFRLEDRTGEAYGKIQVYASQHYDEDTRNQKYSAMRDRAQSLGTSLSEATAWIAPEIQAIPSDRLKTMVEETDGLAMYQHAIDNIVRLRDHTLNAEEEQILAMAGDVTGTFGNTFGAFSNADVTYGMVTDPEGNQVELTRGRYRAFQESPNRAVREESWKVFYEAYEKLGNTLASNLSGNVKSHIFNAKARGYSSALAASLDLNAIPTEVYTNLVQTVSDNLEPLHRYMALRERVLGVEQLEPWDMSAPLAPGLSKTVTFEEAWKTVEEGLAPLGPEYRKVFDNAFKEGWIDVYETAGKRGGAYSWGSYGTPPYLLLNYNNTMDSMFTLAHEMGHSMHSYFTWHTQPFVYGDYATFVAEVASTTNEAILIENLLQKTTDPEERLALLNHYLEQIRGTFFTQVLFAEFELRMHEMAEAGQPLTEEALDDLYDGIYAKYHGPLVAKEPLTGATWSRIPHFYYNFYVYQYATSYAAATALSKKILTEGKPAVDAYLNFLKSGSSEYPIEELKEAGVDMTTPEPILATIQTFSDLLDQMETLLKETE